MLSIDSIERFIGDGSIVLSIGAYSIEEFEDDGSIVLSICSIEDDGSIVLSIGTCSM